MYSATYILELWGYHTIYYKYFSKNHLLVTDRKPAAMGMRCVTTVWYGKRLKKAQSALLYARWSGMCGRKCYHPEVEFRTNEGKRYNIHLPLLGLTYMDMHRLLTTQTKFDWNFIRQWPKPKNVPLEKHQQILQMISAFNTLLDQWYPNEKPMYPKYLIEQPSHIKELAIIR